MGGTICRCRSSDQASVAIVSLPWFVVNPLLKAVQETEDLLGKPGNFMQIFYTLSIRQNVPIKNIY